MNLRDGPSLTVVALGFELLRHKVQMVSVAVFVITIFAMAIIVLRILLLAKSLHLKAVIACGCKNRLQCFLFLSFLCRIYVGTIHVILWEWLTLEPYALLSAAVQ